MELLNYYFDLRLRHVGANHNLPQFFQLINKSFKSLRFSQVSLNITVSLFFTLQVLSKRYIVILVLDEKSDFF